MSISPLASQLRRLRVRERTVRFASYTAAAAAGAIAAAPWVYFLSGSAVTMAIATLTALLCAAAAAAVLGLSERAVAVAADRALKLDDRIVTAVQHLADTDAVSRLVVADAERRLHGVTAAAVFPFALPKRYAPIAAIATVASLAGIVLLMAGDGPSAQRATFARAGGDGATASGRNDARPAGASEDGSRTGTRTVPGVPGAAPAATPAPGATLPSPAPATPIGGRSGSPTISVQRDSRSSPVTSQGRDLRARGSSTAAAGQRSPLGGGVSGSTRPRAGGTQRGEGAQDRARGGAPRPARARGDIPPEHDVAEAAMARESVPAGLRAYVRNYFAAIRDGIPADKRQ